MKLYKAFAVFTLVSAPLIVLITEGLAPRPGQSFAPPPMATSSFPDPASFSQPTPGAGKPFLAPGAGLPGTAAPETLSEPQENSESSPEG